MKKKILGLVIVICLILPNVFVLSACDDGITDVAYVQFVAADESAYVVEYTSSRDGYHIYLLPKNYEELDNPFGQTSFENAYIVKIRFNDNYGIADSIDDKKALCVQIEGWTEMEIAIREEYYYTSSDKLTPKKVYLNGEDITSKAKPEFSKPPIEGSHALGNFWYDGYYLFEDFGLVKGNTSNFINTIELK